MRNVRPAPEVVAAHTQELTQGCQPQGTAVELREFLRELESRRQIDLVVNAGPADPLPSLAEGQRRRLGKGWLCLPG